MNERENARYWEDNAADWTRLVRAGYDVSRDLVNTPSFLAMLPDVRGRRGLDVGCGEGHNTRLVAERGARMVAVDIAWGMVRPGAEHERAQPRGIRYLRASGLRLPFSDGSFDFATAFMSLMDMPRADLALGEMARVVAAGGFVQFSILHPCFARGTPPEWLYDQAGHKRGLVVSDYFRELAGVVDEWSFGAARRDGAQARPFRIPYFMTTLAEWLNRVVAAGLVIEHVAEPRPDQAALARVPELGWSMQVPWFLQLRARKPRS